MEICENVMNYPHFSSAPLAKLTPLPFFMSSHLSVLPVIYIFNTCFFHFPVKDSSLLSCPLCMEPPCGLVNKVIKAHIPRNPLSTPDLPPSSPSNPFLRATFTEKPIRNCQMIMDRSMVSREF